MKMTIVVEDRFMSVDGVGINFDIDIDDDIRAIQWNGSSGEIEYNNGTHNKNITDISSYEYLIDVHTVEIEKRRVAIENEDKIAEEKELARFTWDKKRRDAYPDIGDQLDSLFHAGAFPSEMADKLQAVKDKYPKP
jgi:hypothetical protein